MEKNKNPLSPHLQIYRWHVSSLLSISHRIIGVVNFLVITIICFWVLSLLLGENSYESTKAFLNTYFGKFLIISICWSFSFHILNEIRHLAWDLGYGFELGTAKITGILVFIGSFILTLIFFIIGKNFI
tara:strand:+ start:165 stop:551 length:387 start_codon:yes stop_codon:yes gene_type:complete